ncbi:hypothetical protein HNQ85_002402 [Anoxybacillus calidus]|jgi:hypothetical protein|uniref:Uncharacterized protein n=1 Tax=[Anoxybacillus] calidus TaxID=575178 RepID=A0A7V9Z1B8_9BACL|nr:hypothetical protein [Anoxybacillus calidus]MBA2872112.1 hypothetical protein [Anoxybacillus calidus]
MIRVFVYLIGFGFSIIGGVTTITYLNIITAEQGIIDYFYFISKKVECYLFPFGFFLMWLSLYFPNNQE